jgi:hypothetical protein
MSKGSSPRPFAVSNEEYSNRWDAIFGRDNEKKNETQSVESARIEATATFSGGKGDSSPPCCYSSVMTNTDDEVVNVDSTTSK